MRVLLSLVAVALAFGAGENALVAEPPTKGELKAATENLKKIGIGFHGYGDAHNSKWADDITDKDGRVLLSWRVAILPYLDEENLYRQFKLDEPWDSENNKKLIAKMPKVYAPVRAKLKAGETLCQRFVGKGAIWDEKGTKYTIPTLPDGTSNTALVVEAATPVVWSQPGDLPFAEKLPLPGLGGDFDGAFHMVLCDGSVYFVGKKFSEKIMKLIIQPDDGTPVDFNNLSK
jgi:hypothetical protein